MDLQVLFIAAGILGWLAHRKRVRDVEEGRIEGVPQSKGLMDFMFFRERE